MGRGFERRIEKKRGMKNLSVVSGLVILAFALCVETFWVLVDVLSAIMGPDDETKTRISEK